MIERKQLPLDLGFENDEFTSKASEAAAKDRAQKKELLLQLHESRNNTGLIVPERKKTPQVPSLEEIQENHLELAANHR